MTVAEILHNILIGPLELFFEVVFVLANRIIDNPGLSIIALSLAMNFLVLPLYKRADAMQEEERQIDQKLSPWVKHIKSAFKGDERFMILQTFYRQNNYKPTDALKGSISLLLEIPFFIAAYQFLSHLQIIKGVSFGPIADLGAPDAMFVVAGFTINILPILMTLINFVSASIYMKGFPLKSKVQMYGMAIIFLVFLYNSPAGLVFYWTLNNLFSLVKNIFYKLRNPKLVLSVLASVCGIILIGVGIVHPMTTTVREAFVLCMGLALQIPIVSTLISRVRSKNGMTEMQKSVEMTEDELHKVKRVFFAAMVFMTILTGVLIPSALIESSPAEFINITYFKNPMWYVLNSGTIAAGLFIVWCGVFFGLATDGGKKVMAAFAWIASVVALIDYMFFGRNFGTILKNLKFEKEPVFDMNQKLINLGVILVVAVICWAIYRYKKAFVSGLIVVACLAFAFMSGKNIKSGLQGIELTKTAMENANSETPSIELSKTGQNVIVFMLDRAIGAYVPYIMNEKPELKEVYDGFTYYPNTISYGGHTNVGTPVLFGGYDYRPELINSRTDKPLKDEQNEALRVMPVLFDENGYGVTVCDPPYAGYSFFSDLSIYDDHPNIKSYITIGTCYDYTAAEKRLENTYKRNFFCYSLFKIVPFGIQEVLYDNGNYHAAEKEEVTAYTTEEDKKQQELMEAAGSYEMQGYTVSDGINSEFMDNYTVLQKLPEMTVIREEAKNTFLMIDNELPHKGQLLQEPDYTPEVHVDNTEYDATHTDRLTVNGRTMKWDDQVHAVHYEANMAAFLKVGEWLQYLKEQGVYDNTRIIIVSDHGFDAEQFEGYMLNDGCDPTLFNALLMVKDFGETGFKSSDEFMTIADVPGLATDEIIENAKNPFTGNLLKDDSQKQGRQNILETEWNITYNNGNRFAGGTWYSVEKDIFDLNNWRIEGVNP